MTTNERSLRVFLCHASSDKPVVQKLYKRLLKDGIDAWLDKEKLIPGQNWQIEIPKAVKNSDVVIVCLSSQSVNKEGFVQKEIKFALDAADEKPEGTIFLIPARLENCNVPDRISQYHWVDIFTNDGYERLLKALQIRANTLNVAVKPIINNTGFEVQQATYPTESPNQIEKEVELPQKSQPKVEANIESEKVIEKDSISRVEKLENLKITKKQPKKRKVSLIVFSTLSIAFFSLFFLLPITIISGFFTYHLDTLTIANYFSVGFYLTAVVVTNIYKKSKEIKNSINSAR